MFTHSIQLSVYILFHCIIHVSLFFSLSSCVFEKFAKTPNISRFFLVFISSLISCSIKRKPKKISRSSFACWELSRVNSFYRFCFPFYLLVRENQKLQKYFSVFLWTSFLFIRVLPRRRPRWKCWVALIWIIVELIRAPWLLLLNKMSCRFQLSPWHSCTIIIFTSFGRASERQ